MSEIEALSPGLVLVGVQVRVEGERAGGEWDLPQSSLSCLHGSQLTVSLQSASY